MFTLVINEIADHIPRIQFMPMERVSVTPNITRNNISIPAITLCENCGQQYPTVPHGRTCPHCQSPHTHLLQGNEMMIKEVEAVEPETSEASG